ncbi:MAG: multicopper oxidase [Mycobacterium sp.]|nr:multicopper oxidase [Mycobacterium sp.]
MAGPARLRARPHTGLDVDYGLYLPVIVEDPREPANYDAEWIVVLDDWSDGIGKTPQELYDDLTGTHMPAMDNMPGMGGMPMMSVGTSACSAQTPTTSTTPTTWSTGEYLCSQHIYRQPGAAEPDPAHQRRLRHRFSRRVDRTRWRARSRPQARAGSPSTASPTAAPSRCRSGRANGPC